MKTHTNKIWKCCRYQAKVMFCTSVCFPCLLLCLSRLFTWLCGVKYTFYKLGGRLLTTVFYTTLHKSVTVRIQIGSTFFLKDTKQWEQEKSNNKSTKKYPEVKILPWKGRIDKCQESLLLLFMWKPCRSCKEWLHKFLIVSWIGCFMLFQY